jgi:hypothetical protein
VVWVLSDQFGGGFRERPARVVLEVPVMRHDIAQERVERPIVVDQALVEEPWAPVVQDPADIEDDGRGQRVAQPWRALKRRLVLLIT